MKKTKETKRRVLIVFSMLLIVILSFFILDKRTTFADSGFDFSYDGGSSYSDYGSSHDYDYGSSYDYGRNYRDGNNYRTDSFGKIFAVILVLLLLLLYHVIAEKTRARYNNYSYSPAVTEIDDSAVEERVKKYIPDFYKHEFLRDGYKIYCDIQNAWMNFELEKVRDVITDELYSMYAMQLETLKNKGNQNIMGDFELKKCYLKDVIMENNTITITTGYIIELFDYIVDITTGEVIRGRRNNKARVDYEMRFRKTLNENEKINQCPNCGAELNINSAGYCNYCNAKIVIENTKWVLTEKKVLGQIYL